MHSYPLSASARRLCISTYWEYIYPNMMRSEGQLATRKLRSEDNHTDK